VGVGMMRKTQ